MATIYLKHGKESWGKYFLHARLKWKDKNNTHLYFFFFIDQTTEIALTQCVHVAQSLKHKSHFGLSNLNAYTTKKVSSYFYDYYIPTLGGLVEKKWICSMACFIHYSQLYTYFYTHFI